MSQYSWGTMDPDEESGTQLAVDLNAFRDALYSGHSGTSRPAYATQGLIWTDTSVTPYAVYKYDGDSDCLMGYFDPASSLWAPVIGGGQANVNVAGTTDIGLVRGSTAVLVGAGTITSFGSNMVPGQMKTLIVNDGFTITHHATQMNLPAGATTVFSANDRLLVVCTSAGNYHVLVHTKYGNSALIDPGIIMEYAGLVLPGGYLWAGGQAVSRTTYAALFNAITLQVTGTVSNGSATITSVSSTANVQEGMPLSGTGIQAGAVVKTFTSNTIVMDRVATGGSAGQAIVIAPWGVGNGTTTFNVPNRAGRWGVGRDDLSGAAQNNNQVVTTLTTTNGSALGTVGDASGLFIGMYIVNPNVPPGTQITDISGTTINMGSGTGVTSGTTVSTRFSPVQNAQRLGATGGEIGHTPSLREMVQHAHTLTVTNPTHVHSYIPAVTSFRLQYGPSATGVPGSANTSAVAQATTVTMANTGESFKSNNTPVSVVTGYMVKT